MFTNIAFSSVTATLSCTVLINHCEIIISQVDQ